MLFRSGHLNFEAYVQYREYAGFIQAMSALRGMKLMYKGEDGKAVACNIKVRAGPRGRGRGPGVSAPAAGPRPAGRQARGGERAAPFFSRKLHLQGGVREPSVFPWPRGGRAGTPWKELQPGPAGAPQAPTRP